MSGYNLGVLLSNCGQIRARWIKVLNGFNPSGPSWHSKHGQINRPVIYRQNTEDPHIYRDVYINNCYAVDESWFDDDKTSIVFDIGAQIGSFSRKVQDIAFDVDIHAFELVKENYDLYIQNNPNAIAHNAAAVGIHQFCGIRKNNNNTGGHQAVFRDTESYLNYDAFDPSMVDTKTEVKSIRISDYMQQFECVDVLKLDCEGSEYEILPDLIATGEIDKVQRIVLELHNPKEPDKQKQLLDSLTNSGFRLTMLRKQIYMAARI